MPFTLPLVVCVCAYVCMWFCGASEIGFTNGFMDDFFWPTETLTETWGPHHLLSCLLYMENRPTPMIYYIASVPFGLPVTALHELVLTSSVITSNSRSHGSRSLVDLCRNDTRRTELLLFTGNSHSKLSATRVPPLTELWQTCWFSDASSCSHRRLGRWLFSCTHN